MNRSWVREHMKVIITGIVAVMAIVGAIVITSTIVRGELSSSTVSIITTMFVPTLAALVALATTENVQNRVKRLEEKTDNKNEERPVRSVNSGKGESA